MQISQEAQTLKNCMDALLNAHNAFDSALWHADHAAMMRAQKQIEAARCKAALASRRFERTIGELERLTHMLESDDVVELEQNTRLT
jgi:hypothetical protein